MRILVVEDVASIRELLKDILESQGYEVSCAADGVEALHILCADDGEFDLVLSDVDMPEMDGVDLLGHLTNGLPIVFMTGDSSGAQEKRLRDAGYRGPLLHKPWKLRTLFAVVGAAVNPDK